LTLHHPLYRPLHNPCTTPVHHHPPYTPRGRCTAPRPDGGVCPTAQKIDGLQACEPKTTQAASPTRRRGASIIKPARAARAIAAGAICGIRKMPRWRCARCAGREELAGRFEPCTIGHAAHKGFRGLRLSIQEVRRNDERGRPAMIASYFPEEEYRDIRDAIIAFRRGRVANVVGSFNARSCRNELPRQTRQGRE
jgi:hypothetical protein